MVAGVASGFAEYFNLDPTIVRALWVAIAGPAGELRYGELDRRADVLARVLAGGGVRAGDRVVIWADKSPQAVVAMQAVLRLGAAYVPAGRDASRKRPVASVVASRCSEPSARRTAITAMY